MLIIPSKMGFDIIAYGGLHHFSAPDFNPVQLLTYMFMHSTDTFAPLFFNMFTLWMFGITLERVLGSQRFLFFYITVGIGAGLFQELGWGLTWQGPFFEWIHQSTGQPIELIKSAYATGDLSLWQSFYLNHMVTIGASGAIYGILLAFGMLFSNRPLLLMFILVHIKANYMVIDYGVIERLPGVEGKAGKAHFAQLGGLQFGFLLHSY